MQLITSFVAAAILETNAAAHPGHDMRAETAERAASMQTSKGDPSHCAVKMKARGSQERSTTASKFFHISRSSIKLVTAIDEPHLKVRDAETVSNPTHLSSTASTLLRVKLVSTSSSTPR